MKTLMMFAMTLALAASFGCQTSSRGGGMSRDEGFTISAPGMNTEVKQGELRTVTLSLHRGDAFKRDVSLEIRPSEGISVEPTHVVVKGSEQPEVQLRIAASKDANLGEYRVYVTGTPDTGEPTSVEFKVKVVSP